MSNRPKVRAPELGSTPGLDINFRRDIESRPFGFVNYYLALGLLQMSRKPEAIVLRDIIRLSEMREVESLQKEIWGVEDREVFPALALRPLIEVGAILIGAFDQDQMVGFVFGFPGLEKDRPILHSDMLAVKLTYRSSGLGYRLKLAQRERALAKNIDTITWTFDPLQSVNALLNFKKLGVVADRYMINFYGETSSFLHRAGTDRLWVTWLLPSDRVNKRLSHNSTDDTAWSERRRMTAVVQVGDNFEPVVSNSGTQEPRLIIEIPGDLNRLAEERVRLATRWRETTREAFTEAIDKGYVVEDFCFAERNGQKIGVYLLELRDTVTVAK